MLGKNFFFFLHFDLSGLPFLEAKSAICPSCLLRSFRKSVSTFLKYSISCKSSDPTVPLVPIGEDHICPIFQ
ncbi:hypothetical protein Syun_012189 [Stephania yunnanensis]|uniref:Secreted protein n=1 Tax=Stephania yunnanensis TaxID=152371 RepID=A0AAP0JZS5_9MAGN